MPDHGFDVAHALGGQMGGLVESFEREGSRQPGGVVSVGDEIPDPPQRNDGAGHENHRREDPPAHRGQPTLTARRSRRLPGRSTRLTLMNNLP